MRTLLALSLIFLSLAACGPITMPASATPLPAPTTSATAPAPTQNAGLGDLRIWVTPRFDPANDPLLQARLDAFAEQHAGISIEVRVKEEASLIESLRLTALAAPGASPDLVAFSRADLESAARQGLIQPMEPSLVNDETWHPLARSLSQINDSIYGLPFALDALALATSTAEPLPDWQAISEAGTLAFNANDASFPLGLYLSAGGELSDPEGRPMLDEAALVRVLSLFASGAYLSLGSDVEVVSALGQGSATAVTWSGNFLTRGQPDIQMGALPGLETPSASLVTSWCWSVTSTDLERWGLALELADWLTGAEFLGEWIPSTGYITPRLDLRWESLLDPALPIPDAELVQAVSPILSEAVMSVLNGTSPETAAQEAVEKLK